MGIQAQDDDYPDQVGTESQVLNTMTLTCLYVKKKKVISKSGVQKRKSGI